MGSTPVKCGKCDLPSTAKYKISVPAEDQLLLLEMFRDAHDLGIYMREEEMIYNHSSDNQRSYRRKIRKAEIEVYRCNEHFVRASSLYGGWGLSKEEN